MNRTGLFIALGVELVTGVLFAVFPQLDLTLAHLFYDSSSRRFTIEAICVGTWSHVAFSLPEAVSRANRKATVVYPNIVPVEASIRDVLIATLQVNRPRPSNKDMNASPGLKEKFDW